MGNLSEDSICTTRAWVLDRANEIVHDDRNKTNGDPGPHLAQLARLWSAYLGRAIGPQDVAALLILLKVSRISRSPRDLDHWVDIAGYAACGAEAVVYTEAGGANIKPLAAETAWADIEYRETEE